MAKHITDPANNNYTFGKLFNYAVWTPETEILLANVPWSNDYRDVVRFANGHTGLNNYLQDQPSTLAKTQMSYARFDRPISIDTPFNAATRYNYIRVRNPLSKNQIGGADIQRDYYYFILGMEYINTNTTLISVELDVWQTFGYDIRIGNCYIERGHIGIANENNFNNYGRDYLTVPEGLDIGGEYMVVTKQREKIMTNSWGTDGITGATPSEPGYDILACSTVDLTADPGTVDAPKLVTAKGGTIQNLPSGASFYIFNGINSFTAYMNKMREKPWVTQGIISITAIPRVKRYLPNFDYNNDDTDNPGMTLAPALGMPTITHQMMPAWRTEEGGIKDYFPARYRHLKKFFTYPYMVIELTTWGATPLIIKPESWADDNGTVTETVAIVPPNQRVVISPQRYNARPGSIIEQKRSWLDFGDSEPAEWPYPADLGDGDDQGEYLDYATLITNFPTMAVVNNSAIGYMASNAHGIVFQSQSADWAQDKALRGAGNAYYSAQVGLQTDRANFRESNALDRANTWNGVSAAYQGQLAGAVSGVVQGAVGGALAGSVVGAAGGTAAGAIGSMANSVQLNIQSDATLSSMNNRSATGQQILDNNQRAGNTISQSNKQLAEYAARGDYENTIAGIQAKVQDAKMLQPSVSGQVGGEAFNLVNDNVEISIRFKTLDPANIRRIGEKWLRYGYAVEQFGRIPDDFMVMDKFTYWKLTETYVINGPMPELFKQAFRGIFEKGVTVWRNPADIGNIDIANNAPLEGITL